SFAKLCSTEEGAIDSPRAYLFETARNLALNDLRRSRIAPIAEISQTDFLRARAQGANPEEQLLAQEELGRLNAVIMALAPHLRQAVLLCKMEGLTHREIAHRLGVTERSVRRYIADALVQCHLALTTESATPAQKAGGRA